MNFQDHIFKIFLLLFFMLPLLSQAQESIENSSIDQVTIYRQGATVVRSVVTELQAGNQELRISGLSPDLDPNSIQLLSNADFILSSLSHQYNYLSELEKPEDYRSLIEQREKIEMQIQDLELEFALINEEKQLLEENRAIASENEGLNLQRLIDFTSYYNKKMRVFYTEKQKLLRQKKELLEQKQKLDDQIGEYERTLKGKRVAEVVLQVNSEEKQKVTLQLRYIVRSAGWQSSYDIRARSTEDDLKIQQFANVYNRSQERWNNVKLVLSTGSPGRRLYLPELNPWWLRFWEVSKKREMAKMQADGIVAMEPVTPEGPSVEIEEQLITTNFTVDGQQDIPADGKVHRFLINTTELPYVKEYRSIPKLDPAVYLTAKLVDWESAYLSPGEMKIYLDGGYIGKTFLNPSTVVDTLDIALGVDENITVQRKKITRFTKKQFLGKNVTERFAYKIQVRNLRSRNITLTIQDQVPVSTNNEIEVEPGEIDGADYDPKTGLLSWKIELAPKGSAEIAFDFTVKYPKGKRVNIY